MYLVYEFITSYITHCTVTKWYTFQVFSLRLSFLLCSIFHGIFFTYFVDGRTSLFAIWTWLFLL